MTTDTLTAAQVQEISDYPKTGDPWKSHEAIDALARSHEQLRLRVQELETAIERTRTDIGMTVCESTPVSVSSGRRIVDDLGTVLKGSRV